MPAAQRAAEQLLDLLRDVFFERERLFAAADHLARGTQLAGLRERDNARAPTSGACPSPCPASP
jgi:hypothetical protein